MSSAYPLIFIVGPTASGKSDLGLRLAETYGGSILNGDSLQVYQRLDIGTAKPTRLERERVPHLVFDVIPPGQVLTAGDYRRLALSALEAAIPKGPVFLVGGSGFYIQALEKGMFGTEKPDLRIEQEVREDLAARGPAYLYECLKALDAEYAGVVSPNDTYRIVRALVMMRESGRTVSELRRSFKAARLPYPLLKLGLDPDRVWLRPRVESRVRRMLESGLLEEVQELIRDGFADWPPLQSVGYKECLAHLRGELAYGDLAPLIVEKTLQLAKKQRTWFQRDTEIQWLPADHPATRASDLVADLLRKLGRLS